MPALRLTTLLAILLCSALIAQEQPPAEQIQLHQSLADLSHPSLARRATATANLVAAGERGALLVRPLCRNSDAALALRARQVFGAVFGVPPETHELVTDRIERARSQQGVAAEVESEIRAAGSDAVALAQRLCAPGEDEAPSELFAHLVVRSALERIAAGVDRDGTAAKSILDLSRSAAPALLLVARDRDADRAPRLHALWLYGLLGGADRVQQLAALLDDPDAVLRSESARLAAEAARAEDFAAVAGAIGGTPSAERQRLAQALAGRVDTDTLAGMVRGRRDPTAAFAALTLGFQRTEAARDALIAAAADRKGGVAEAVVTALGEFTGKEATEAVAEVYATSDNPQVRAAALVSLRHRTGEDPALRTLTAALFDDDAAVRLAATDALGALSRESAAPALILAALEDPSDALRARALSAVGRLLPARAGMDGAKGDSAEAWRAWLMRQDSDLHRDELPWYRASREAVNLVESVRARIESEFFYFDDEELVAEENLDEAALKALRAALKDRIAAEGHDRQLLERVIGSSHLSKPDRLLAALGAIPFATDVSDLVRLTNAAAQGMVKSLGDPYSRLDASNDAEGRPRPEWLPGMLDDNDEINGMAVRKKDDRYVVDFVLFDSAAFHAGIRRGDQLVKIDDEFVAEIDPKELRKKVNAEGEFHILREGWNRPHGFRLTPTRAQSTHVVTKALLPGKIGYVRLKMFELGCSVRLERAISELERVGIEGLILDLRNNPGGTVIDATAIVDLFLPKGKLITVNETRSSEDETEEEEARSTAKGSNRDYPLVVLVNRSSASASEMTSGSLQGNQRAVVVGETSFGKGIGQSGSAIAGFSSDTALGRSSSLYTLTLTMMRYYLPEGKRSIHGVGVEPDVSVRERSLRGSALDKSMRAVHSKALSRFVERLITDDREIAIELAVFDGDDGSRYPGFDELAEQVRRWVDPDRARQLVRAELRRRMLTEGDDAAFEQLFYDLQEDRTLRAGIRELANLTDQNLDGIPEYAGLR